MRTCISMILCVVTHGSRHFLLEDSSKLWLSSVEVFFCSQFVQLIFFSSDFPPHVLVCSVVQCVSPTSTESCSFDHAEFDMFTMILNLSRSCFESHEQPPSSLISQFQTSEWKKCSFHWSYHLRPSLFPSWHFSMWFFFTQIASFIAFEFDKTIGLFWFFFFFVLII